MLPDPEGGRFFVAGSATRPPQGLSPGQGLRLPARQCKTNTVSGSAHTEGPVSNPAIPAEAGNPLSAMPLTDAHRRHNPAGLVIGVGINKPCSQPFTAQETGFKG